MVELGAGEGRNAVWLARRGFQVTAVDYAEAGLEKTHRLAAQQGVAVETIQPTSRDGNRTAPGTPW
ncbi:class I SAM-dependent methyltransferase [Rhodothermus marinus]|uniref:class I SAM-dependent methyltransferase n=1 Tax=Rhodothermus marinus TaxID=29549 RepID=UPI001FB1AF69|nr:class I SAM-dependent methyltransferase [Rhodothermus marinus]